MLKNLKNLSIEIFESLNKNKSHKILKKNIKFRRSIFAKKNIKKNEKITRKNTISLRPTIGIKSENLSKIIGKKTLKNINKDEPIFYHNLKSK